MKYIKVYESYNETTIFGIDQLKKLIKTGLTTEPKTPIVLVTKEEKPGLTKLLTEMTEEVQQDMIYINLDSKMGPVDVLPLFPEDNGLDEEGGMIFLEGIEDSSPSIKAKVFGFSYRPGKITDGSIPSKWLVVIKTPSVLAIPPGGIPENSIIVNLK
jgi:hypothetical protein